MHRGRFTAMALLGLATALVPLGSGCAVEKRRAAIVPHMVPTPRSGQPIRGGSGTFYLHHSAVTHMRNPHEAPDANAGIYIPRYQIGGGTRFRLGRDFDLGLIFEVGLQYGSVAVAQDVPPRPRSDPFGIGISFGYSIRATSRFRIGLAFEPMLYAIPKVEYLASVCNPPDWVGCVPDDKGTEIVPVFSLSIIPSVLVTNWLVLFGGITLRNHPTIEKVGWETPWDDEDVEIGPLNVTLGLGAEFRLHKRVFFMLQLYYPVTRDPVVYYPVVGAGFTVAFGQEYRAIPRAPQHGPAPYPAPPTYAPPPTTAPPATTPPPPPPPPADPSTAPRTPAEPSAAPRLPPDAQPVQ